MEPEKRELLEKSKQEFARRRKVLLSDIPDGVDLEELKHTILEGLEALQVTIQNKSVLILFKNVKQAETGVETLKSLNSDFKDKGINVNFPEPDSLLFVGNLPLEFNGDQLGELMSQYGPLERVFLVRSEVTGESKGYGFAEYADKKTAGEAKQQLLKSGAKYISGRILRVDFAEPNLRTYKDLQSRTLFIDKLPRDFIDGEVLRKLFSESGKVSYAQVAINSQLGTSRGFAFVDYETSEEAEKGQIAHNDAKIGNCNIRTSYGTPGRLGASVLGSRLPGYIGQNSKPASLMSTTLPNTLIRVPPGPQLNPRPLMAAPMICPDPSVHLMRGPVPSQLWGPRPHFPPRPAGVYPGSGPRLPMPRGPHPLMTDVRAQRPIGPRGHPPAAILGSQQSGLARPLMDPKHDSLLDQFGGNTMATTSLLQTQTSNQYSPQPLIQSPNQQQPQHNALQDVQPTFQTKLHPNAPQQAVGSVMSGSGIGYHGQHVSGNGTRLGTNGPTPLMSVINNSALGRQQVPGYSNSNPQSASQVVQPYPGYQPTGQSDGYSTAYNSKQVYTQSSSAGQSQQEWPSLYTQQQQYNTSALGGSANSQTYCAQPQTSTPYTFTGTQGSKQQLDSEQAVKTSTSYQTSGDMYGVYYNASKRPRY